jgi:DNA-binding IclR family transcriptional regulator
MPRGEKVDGVKSVNQALAILRHVARSGEPNGVTAIAKAVGISSSSCFAIVKTLTAEGFLAFESGTKRYSLGHGAIELAHGSLDDRTVLRKCQAEMNALAERFELTSVLWRLTSEQRLVLIGASESRGRLRIQMTLGQRLPMLAGAMGRSVVAHLGLDTNAMAQSIATIRWPNPPSLTEYIEQVGLAKRSGWSIDDDQFIRGVTTIAAVIEDQHGSIRFCIANSFFTGQHALELLPQIGAATKEAATIMGTHIFGKRPDRV